MRLFISINFTEEIKNILYDQILNLKRQSVKGNFTRKENLHLTLAFLGEVCGKQIETLVHVMNQSEFSEFMIEFSSMSAFRNNDELLPWIGIVPNKKLLALQSQLINNLKISGFTPDEKDFTPHITLGRKVMLQNNAELPIQYGLYGKEMAVNAISLMKSERLNGILTYTEIYKRKIS